MTHAQNYPKLKTFGAKKKSNLFIAAFGPVIWVIRFKANHQAYTGCRSQQDCGGWSFIWSLYDCESFDPCLRIILLWNCSIWGLQSDPHSLWLSGTWPFYLTRTNIEAEDLFASMLLILLSPVHTWYPGLMFDTDEFVALLCGCSLRRELFGQLRRPTLRWVLTCMQIA